MECNCENIKSPKENNCDVGLAYRSYDDMILSMQDQYKSNGMVRLNFNGNYDKEIYKLMLNKIICNDDEVNSHIKKHPLIYDEENKSYKNYSE